MYLALPGSSLSTARCVALHKSHILPASFIFAALSDWLTEKGRLSAGLLAHRPETPPHSQPDCTPPTEVLSPPPPNPVTSMADPLSIAASCIAVMTAVGQTTRLVRDFVRTYRNARTDLVRLSQETSGLDLILQSLHDIVSDGTGIAGVPPQVLEQLDTIIRDCGSILDNIQAVLDGFVGTWAETTWVLTGKKKIADQVVLLEANRKALDLALSTIDLCVNSDYQS